MAGVETTGSSSATPDFSALKAGQMVRGKRRYRLNQSLGTGSFGVVWCATCLDRTPVTQDTPPETVAIKFFEPPRQSDGTNTIKRELSALLSMRARNVPRVYDWFIHHGISFFVMDYFKHGSLADTFQAPGQLNDAQAWRLLVDLMRALQAAHREGILHLDIKPANVMHDGSGGFALLDFGISQASQITHGPARTVGAGSVGYQAPEQQQLALDKFDTRTDVWAVGATVWSLRSGINLRLHAEYVNHNARGAEPSLPALSSVCSVCAPDLAAIVMSLLCFDRQARPGGAAEVLARMKAAATGQPFERPKIDGELRSRDDKMVQEVIASLMDPLWSSICSSNDLECDFVRFDEGSYICRESEFSHHAYLLLSGRVRVERGQNIIAMYDREGTFVGEISTLTGTPRTASIRADSTVWACAFNAAEFERLLAHNPAVGIRLVKLMSERLIRADIRRE